MHAFIMRRNVLSNFEYVWTTAFLDSGMNLSVTACKACYREGFLPVACEYLRCLRKKIYETSLKLKKIESSRFSSLLFFPITEVLVIGCIKTYNDLVTMYAAHFPWSLQMLSDLIFTAFLWWMGYIWSPYGR